MAIMNAFRNMFGGTTADGNPANQGTAPSGAAVNPTIPNNNTLKSDGSLTAIPASPDNAKQSPLDGFTKLWETKTADGADSPEPSLIPRLNIDPAKLSQTVAGLDFTKGIPQELLSKALSGDHASMIAAINSAVQQSFQYGVQSSARMIEEAFTSQSNTLLTHTLPNTVRNLNASAVVADSSPIMNNPAVAPLVKVVQSQFAANNPTATAAEISQHVTAYFDAMGQEFLKAGGYTVLSPEQVAAKNNTPGRRQETNWETFLPN